MKTIIIYATYSSGTHEAASRTKEYLEEKGHQVTVQQAKQSKPEDIEPYELVILASPSWEVDHKDGQPHIDMGNLIKQFQDKSYPGKKFAILGLGDIHYARFCGAVDHLEEFVKNLQGEIVTKSLRINRYPFHEDENNELIRQWAGTFA